MIAHSTLLVSSMHASARLLAAAALLSLLPLARAERRDGPSDNRRPPAPDQRSRHVPQEVRDAAHSNSSGEPGDPSPQFGGEHRTVDGSSNNVEHIEWGAAETAFLRLLPAAYADGVELPSGLDRPNAREISNAVMAQEGSIPNSHKASDYLWQWGQFLDHDLTETPVASPEEPFDIEVPAGDPYFDPTGTGEEVIPLNRSLYSLETGVREQLNLITAFIDASNVYGSDEERADALRTLDGTGRLKTSEGGLLPYNEEGVDNVPDSSDTWFLAGDVRANEQVGLTCMHTLFVREHNFMARILGEANPGLSGDEIYEMARAIVAAELQIVTYHEFLPLLLGPKSLPPYEGYRKGVNPGISNEFATASYRLGHSMLSTELLRLDASGNTIAAGNLSLAEAFFQPSEVEDNGIAPVLRGLAAQVCQEIDPFLVDDVRNFLFGPPGAGGFDLAALNIQRGRDHGLPDYNTVRVAMGLEPVTDFSEISSDSSISGALASVYESVDQIDLWVGGLAEDHLPRAQVGETFHRILSDQFRRLRDGDRFFYRNYLPPSLADLLERQTLATIIRRNTDIGGELQQNVFIVPPEVERRTRMLTSVEGPRPPRPKPEDRRR